MKYLAIALTSLLSLQVATVDAAPDLPDEKLAAAKLLLEQNYIEADIAIDQFIAYGNGGGVVSGYQLHNGLKVFDARLTYHFAPGGDAVRMPDGSEFTMAAAQDLASIEIVMDELIDAEAAIAQVRSATGSDDIDSDTLASVQRCATATDRLEVELGILRQRPAWQVRCKYSRTPGAFIDAISGELTTLNLEAPPGAFPMPMPLPAPERK